MPYRFRISPQESWGTYFVCTSYGARLNFVIASQLINRYPAMPANVARSLFIHSRDTKTVWHVDQTLPRAGDAIHPVLWKRCGFQCTNTPTFLASQTHDVQACITKRVWCQPYTYSNLYSTARFLHGQCSKSGNVIFTLLDQAQTISVIGRNLTSHLHVRPPDLENSLIS